MSIVRSSNCEVYTDKVSLLVSGKAFSSSEPERCKVVIPAHFSCQTSNFEKPDELTAEQMKKTAFSLLQEKGCKVEDAKFEFSTNLVGAEQTEHSAEKLVKLGMVSNCWAEGHDPNHATHLGRADCTPQREMTDSKGRRVMNSNMKISSQLMVCDTSEEAMDQVIEDLQKVAAFNASKKGYTLDSYTDLACGYSVLPHI